VEAQGAQPLPQERRSVLESVHTCSALVSRLPPTRCGHPSLSLASGQSVWLQFTMTCLGILPAAQAADSAVPGAPHSRESDAPGGQQRRRSAGGLEGCGGEPG
jgi:hypothetical protein